jgi:hypothetical protein
MAIIKKLTQGGLDTAHSFAHGKRTINEQAM